MIFLLPTLFFSFFLQRCKNSGGNYQEEGQARNAHPDRLLACVQQAWQVGRFLIPLTTKYTCLHHLIFFMIVAFCDCISSWYLFKFVLGYNYTHATVNHSEHFKDPITGVHTNTIEGRLLQITLRNVISNTYKSPIQLYLCICILFVYYF